MVQVKKIKIKKKWLQLKELIKKKWLHVFVQYKTQKIAKGFTLPGINPQNQLLLMSNSDNSITRALKLQDTQKTQDANLELLKDITDKMQKLDTISMLAYTTLSDKTDRHKTTISEIKAELDAIYVKTRRIRNKLNKKVGTTCTKYAK
ncbi:hypothetical protein BB561_000241 [Smittium simulii]|uniref:Uncharacterized protein n=1 Tax=Smittium simulii TaxID=133385 RepID=A0A2T9YZU7_9FUNG|nr:hypothetical protein BB561_000241 [Smittium simulii]